MSRGNLGIAIVCGLLMMDVLAVLDYQLDTVIGIYIFGALLLILLGLLWNT